jgi:Fe2+ transport system protein B
MVETHKDCMDISILDNIIKDVKTSDLFNEIDELINEMAETIGKIRQNRETNSGAVREQKIIVENEIQELRTNINNHLDKLQENLIKELTEAEKQITDHELFVVFIAMFFNFQHVRWQLQVFRYWLRDMISGRFCKTVMV